MMQFGRKRPGRPPAVTRRTSISFSAEDVAVLGHLVAAGQIILQPARRAPVLARLKAAMTRLGVPIPQGL